MYRLLLLCLLALSTAASAFPDQPITIIVPYPPGGSSTPVAKAVSDRLAVSLGQNVLIEHVAGGAGTVGMLRLKQAAPDGHTLLIASMGTHIANPALTKDLPYDPLKDFDSITIAVTMPMVLVVHPSVPANNLQEFIAYLRKHGKVVFTASGAGSVSKMMTDLFWKRTKTAGTLASYKGAGPAVTDIAEGKALASFQHLAAALPLINAGKLKVLAVTSEKRWPSLPNVPTMLESGMDIRFQSWHGVVAPQGLPPDVKKLLHTILVKALRTPAVEQTLENEGFEIVANTPEEFDELVRTEILRWQAILQELDRGKK